MKTKILATALLLSSLSYGAEDGELLFGVKLTDATSGQYSQNVADTTKRSISEIPSTGYINYVDTTTIAGIPFDVMGSSHTGTYNITGEQSANAGLNLTDGFTYGMNLYINTTSNWNIFAAMSIAGVEFSLQNTANGISMQQIDLGSSSGHLGVTGNEVSGVAKNTLVSVFVTGQYDTSSNQLTLAINVFDTNGESIANSSASFASITTSAGNTHDFSANDQVGFRGKGYDSSSATADKNNGGMLVANVGIWSGVAAAEQMEAYAIGTGHNNHDISEFQAIPEPTTSSLSLLALAGLLARRRRRA